MLEYNWMCESGHPKNANSTHSERDVWHLVAGRTGSKKILSVVRQLSDTGQTTVGHVTDSCPYSTRIAVCQQTDSCSPPTDYLLTLFFSPFWACRMCGIEEKERLKNAKIAAISVYLYSCGRCFCIFIQSFFLFGGFLD